MPGRPRAPTPPAVRTGRWTAVERDVLDSLRWWPLDELDAAVGAGMIVYPGSLPALARALLRGWDGTLLTIREED